MQDTLCFNCHFDFDNTLPFILNAVTQPSKANRPTVLADPSGNLQVPSLDQDDSLEKEMATQSSILAWRIRWTEEPGGLQSMRSQRAGHDQVINTSLHFGKS